MHYLLTSNSSVFEVTSRSLRVKRGDSAIGVKFGIKARKLLQEQSNEQQEYVNQSAEAAYSSFNQLDRVNRFKADVNLSLVQGEGGSFIEGSTSGGLIYGLSLFNAWWKDVLNKEVCGLPLFATGELKPTGQINPISGIEIKAQAVLDFVIKHSITAFVFAYPQDNQNDLSPALIEAITKQGGQLIVASRIQEVLTSIYSDKYDGDPEGRWQPFKGLSAFTYADQHRFFGRDDVIQTIIKEIEIAQQTKELVIVSGASGSGKSSVLQAGVIPAIEKKEDNFVFQTVKPSDIGQDLTSWLDKQTLEKGTANLWVIDQFEELFTQLELNQEDEANWLIKLKEANNQYDNLQIILSVRDDFIGGLSKHSTVFPTIKMVNVPSRLTPDQWRMIIGKQAAYSNLIFEAGLANHIVDEASQSKDNLPLVELLLEELYQRSDKRTLTFDIYKKIGGKDKEGNEAGGIKGVITHQAEQALTLIVQGGKSKKTKLTKEEVDAALPHVFQLLIGYQSVEGGVGVSKYATLDENTPKDINILIEAFYEARLLVKKNDTYRIAHEVLITQWHRIQQWLEEDKEFIKWLSEIEQQEKRWRGHGKLKEHLLPKGKSLNDAQRYYVERKKTLPDPIYEYTRESQAFTKRKVRILAMTVIVIMVSLSLLSLLLYQQNTAVIKQKNEGLILQSQFLTDLAEQQLKDNHPTKALLLSLNALPGIYGGQRPGSASAKRSLAQARLMQSKTTVFSHFSGVRDAVFSPDGKKVLTASSGKTVVIWSVESGERLQVFNYEDEGDVEGEDEIYSATFSPDGQRVLTVSNHDRGVLWSVENGKWLQEFRGVNSAVFSPNGQMVLTASNDRTAVIWSVESGERLQEFSHDNDVTSAVFSPDGKKVVTASDDRTAAIWSVGSGKQLQEFPHDNNVHFAVFSPDGLTVLTASKNALAVLWSVESGMWLQEFQHDSLFHSVVFSPDGQMVLTVSRYGAGAHLWSVESGEQLPMYFGDVNSAVFSPEGKMVLTASSNKTATIWSVENGERLKAFQHDEYVNSAVFSPDGQTVLTASNDKTAVIWSVESNEWSQAFQHDNNVRSAVFSPDGQMIVTSSLDETAALWSVESGERLQVFQHDHWVNHATFSSDGKMVVTSSYDKTAALWSVKSGERLQKFQHDDVVHSVVFSPDGKMVLTASDDKTAALWSMGSGERLHEFQHDAGVYTVVFSPDGQMVLTSSFDKTAALWSIESGERLQEFQHDYVVHSAVFSPDGKKVMTKSSDNKAAIWSVGSGERLQVFQHYGNTSSMAFSPDGQRVVTILPYDSVVIWSVESGERLHEFQHDDVVNSAAFSFDGQWVLTASRDQTVKLWSVESGKLEPVIQHSERDEHDVQDVVRMELTLSERKESAIFSPDEQTVLTVKDNIVKVWRNIRFIGVSESIKALPRNRTCLTPQEREKFFLAQLTDEQWIARGCSEFTHKKENSLKKVGFK